MQPLSLVPLLVAGLLAFAVYRDAERRRSTHGSAPRDWAPELWGALTFFLGLFGVLFYFLATRSHDSKRAQSTPARRPFVL